MKYIVFIISKFAEFTLGRHQPFTIEKFDDFISFTQLHVVCSFTSIKTSLQRKGISI